MDHGEDVKQLHESNRHYLSTSKKPVPAPSGAQLIVKDERDDEHDPVVGVSDDHIPTV